MRRFSVPLITLLAALACAGPAAASAHRGAHARPRCVVPAGEHAVARSGQALVYERVRGGDSGPTVILYGCLRATGRITRLAVGADNEDNTFTFGPVALGGRYAAFFSEDDDRHYDSCSAAIERANLRSAAVGPVAGPPCGSGQGVDSVRISADGLVAWRTVEDTVELGGLPGTSCPSTGFCAAIGTGGLALVSDDPASSAPSWTVASIAGENQPSGISCPSASFCAETDVSVDAIGGPAGAPDVITSSDPGGTTPHWSITPLPGIADLNGIACPTASFCVAVGPGVIASSQAPTAGAGAWQVTRVSQMLMGVSCPTTSFCAAIDGSGGVLTSSDPGRPDPTWTLTQIDPGPFIIPNTPAAISCPTASVCVGFDGAGDALSSGDPTGGPSAWQTTEIAHDMLLGGFGVSCPSTAFCAIDDGMQVLVSDDPVGGAGTWQATETFPNQTFPNLFAGAVSCSSASFCLAIPPGSTGFASATPLFPGSWSDRPLSLTQCGVPGCTSDAVYAADSRDIELLDSAGPSPAAQITDLSVSGDSVHWQDDRATRTAVLP